MSVKKILIFFFSIWTFPSFSQSEKVEVDCILPIEIQPSFANGNDSLQKFIYSRIKIPKEYYQALGEFRGKIYVSFYVEKSGKITNPQIMKGLPQFPKLNVEVIKAIKQMPKWKNDGKIKMKFILPIKFGFYDLND